MAANLCTGVSEVYCMPGLGGGALFGPLSASQRLCAVGSARGNKWVRSALYGPAASSHEAHGAPGACVAFVSREVPKWKQVPPSYVFSAR